MTASSPATVFLNRVGSSAEHQSRGETPGQLPDPHILRLWLAAASHIRKDKESVLTAHGKCRQIVITHLLTDLES